MTNTAKGRESENSIRTLLLSKGLKVSHHPYMSPYDLLVNGWRCEVKYAPISSEGKWKFNIHRHGVLREGDVDFYIFALDGVPYSKDRLYVIKKAPLGVKTVQMSFRLLITKYAANVMNFSALSQEKDVE